MFGAMLSMTPTAPEKQSAIEKMLARWQEEPANSGVVTCVAFISFGGFLAGILGIVFSVFSYIVGSVFANSGKSSQK